MYAIANEDHEILPLSGVKINGAKCKLVPLFIEETEALTVLFTLVDQVGLKGFTVTEVKLTTEISVE